MLFKQTICGFDMLREGGQSFVCDVNGVRYFFLSFSMHSFVKKNRKFWADASHLIKLLIYKQLQPSLLTVFLIKKEFPSIFIEIGLGGIGSS